MSIVTRLVALNGISLLLCFPLFAVYAMAPTGKASGEALFALAGAALVYIAIAAFGLPNSVANAVARLGMNRGLIRLVFLYVSSIMVAVPFLDHTGSELPLIGLAFLATSALLFILAVHRAIRTED